MKRPADRERQHPPGARGLERPGGGGHPVDRAGDDDVRGRVVVGGPGPFDPGERLGDRGVVEPEHRNHRAGRRVGGGLHRRAALGDQPYAVVEVDDPRHHQGSQLAK